MIPGEIQTPDGEHLLVPGRERRAMTVVNTGDRPIQIGSHFHFADANAALRFDRSAAAGCRLDVAAGTSVRFEPGVDITVTLVVLGGAARVPGLQLRDREPGR